MPSLLVYYNKLVSLRQGFLKLKYEVRDRIGLSHELRTCFCIKKQAFFLSLKLKIGQECSDIFL